MKQLLCLGAPESVVTPLYTLLLTANYYYYYYHYRYYYICCLLEIVEDSGSAIISILYSTEDGT